MRSSGPNEKGGRHIGDAGDGGEGEDQGNIEEGCASGRMELMVRIWEHCMEALYACIRRWRGGMGFSGSFK